MMFGKLVRHNTTTSTSTLCECCVYCCIFRTNNLTHTHTRTAIVSPRCSHSSFLVYLRRDRDFALHGHSGPACRLSPFYAAHFDAGRLGLERVARALTKLRSHDRRPSAGHRQPSTHTHIRRRARARSRPIACCGRLQSHRGPGAETRAAAVSDVRDRRE